MGGGCQYVCDEAVDVLLAEMECSKNVWCSLEEREAHLKRASGYEATQDEVTATGIVAPAGQWVC